MNLLEEKQFSYLYFNLSDYVWAVYLFCKSGKFKTIFETKEITHNSELSGVLSSIGDVIITIVSVFLIDKIKKH